MKANELRIGNCVWFNDAPQKKGIAIVELIGGKVIHTNQGEAYISEVCGIKITEELLLRMGFESNAYDDRYELGDIDVECDKTKGFTDLWLAGHPHIKHVHQLQNLYFALTGEELEIKQP